RRGNVHAERGFPNALEQAFDEIVNVFALDEGHFDVHLREFGLTVGAKVFVAIAACELKIFFDAADHENLFELLRRLRQRIERSRLATVGHEKFARAFGRGFEQRRRLDFEEALLVHELPRGDGNFGAQFQIARHFGTTQIEVAILQTRFFGNFRGGFGVVNLERQRLGHVQDFERLRHDFDFAGGNFGIVRAGRTLTDFAGDADDTFAAQRRRLFEKFLRQIGRVENGLRAAFAVADINENEASQIAARVDPAGQCDYLPDVRGAQFVAVMRAFHFERTRILA